MRNLLLILVLANLLLLAWQRWIVPPPATDALRLQAARAPELRLLGGGGSPGAGRGSRDCLRLGPFPDEETAGQATRRLAQRNIRATRESQPVEIWLGHWVQVTGFDDRAAALDAREALVAAGLQDAYVVRTDESFKISLGVFRERDRADRVVRLARGAGYQALLTDRTRDGEEYWLVLPPAVGAAADLAGLLASGDQIVRSESVTCPTAAAHGGPGSDSLESAATRAASVPE